MRKGGNMQVFQGEKWSYVKGTSILKNIVKVSVNIYNNTLGI